MKKAMLRSMIGALAIFPEDVLAWVQETQPEAWEKLNNNHGSKAGETVLKRLRESLDKNGTLDVLRHGIDILGLRKKLPMAQFKPAMSINPDILSRYKANRLRVVRQVHYSVHNEKNIDLVLFLNGIPVSTVELKTDFTQSISDAIAQYKYDRNPKTAGKGSEPLLTFPSGALVHFAVSSSEVEMTTKLAGPATSFLPFNLGDGGAKGNPVNIDGGYRTAYLWEDVWQRDGWLEIPLGDTCSPSGIKRRRSIRSSSRDIINLMPHASFKRLCSKMAQAGDTSSSILRALERRTRLRGRHTSSPICTMRSTRNCSIR